MKVCYIHCYLKYKGWGEGRTLTKIGMLEHEQNQPHECIE